MKIFGRLLDFVYIAVIIGLVAGLAIQLSAYVSETPTRIPASWNLPLGILGIFALNLLLELVLPLRALAEERWIYTARPARRMPGFDLQSYLQLLLIGIIGALIGGWQYAVIAVLSRFLMGMRNWSLAQLLAAGRTRSVGLGGIDVQDSELVSQAFAQCNTLWVNTKPSCNPWLLAFRRLQRRFYLPLLGLIIVLLSMATLSPEIFIVAWCVLGAGVARCARFGIFHFPVVLATVIAAHTAVGLLVLCAWEFSPREFIAAGVAIAYASYVRSKPRAVFLLTPLHLVDYYIKGLLPAAVAIAILVS